MLIKLFKFILILILYQGPLYSKNKTLNDFNSRHLSNYFSGIVANKNKDNFKALKFFKSSKPLIKKHNPYLKRYIYSLVLEGEVQQAAIEIKRNSTKNNSNFFEAYLILSLESLKNKRFKESKDYLERSSKFINNDRFALIIYEILKQNLNIFDKKEPFKEKNNFGNLSVINKVFQKCYLEDENTHTYFDALINNSNGDDYSRYTFFYINYLVENNRYQEAKKITDNLDYLKTSLLI